MSKINLKIKKPQFNIKNIKFEKPKFSMPKISLKNIWIILSKELYNFFTQPIGYIISTIFVIAFLIITFGVQKYLQYGTNNLSQIFGYTAFLLSIVIPAITMSSISKERQSGTLEYILTRPIRVVEYILGKIAGNSLIVFVLLLTTIPFTLIASGHTQFDFGQLVMQYFGSMVFSVALVSVGVAVSAGFKNEIGAFLTTIILSALLILLGSELIRLPLILDPFISKFSLISHYQVISQGVIDIRDVIYFVAFIITFVFIGFYLVKKDKYPQDHQDRIGLRNLVILSVVITLLVGYFGQQLVGRIDLTSNKLYTLSEASTQTINNVKDLVTIDIYKSSGLPLEYESEIRSIEALFSDYKSYSGGKLELNYKDPSTSDTAKSDAQSAGLTPVNFTSQSNTSAQVVEGYFGAVVRYKDDSQTINLIDVNNNALVLNPEYEVTKAIRRLTNSELKKIAFVTNNVGASRSSNFTGWDSELSSLFNVVDLEIKAEEDIPTDVAALIIAAPNAKFEDAILNKLKTYYSNGGSIFLLTNSLNVTDLAQAPTANEGSLTELFADYGIGINSEIVYDLESYNTVNIQGYLFPIAYPFWITAETTDVDLAPVKGVNQLSLLWTNSISLESKEGSQYWELAKTTNSSNGEGADKVSLSLDREYTFQESDKSRLIALATENSKQGRAVIVADWKFLSDTNSLVSRLDNLTFGISSVEWLTKEDGLSSIKAKDRAPLRVILTESEGLTLVALSFVIPAIGLIIVASSQYYLRKRLDA